MRERNSLSLALTIAEQLFRVWSELPSSETARFLYEAINITTIVSDSAARSSADVTYLVGEIDALAGSVTDCTSGAELSRIGHLLMILAKSIEAEE